MSRAVICGVALCLAFGSTWARADETDDRVAERVRELNGEIVRDEKRPGKPVVEVRLGSYEFRRLTAADLRMLTPLKDLKLLGISGSGFTTADIKEIGPLPGLATLDLSYTDITDQGLSEPALST